MSSSAWSFFVDFQEITSIFVFYSSWLVFSSFPPIISSSENFLQFSCLEVFEWLQWFWVSSDFQLPRWIFVVVIFAGCYMLNFEFVLWTFWSSPQSIDFRKSQANHLWWWSLTPTTWHDFQKAILVIFWLLFYEFYVEVDTLCFVCVLFFFHCSPIEWTTQAP